MSSEIDPHDLSMIEHKNRRRIPKKPDPMDLIYEGNETPKAMTLEERYGIGWHEPVRYTPRATEVTTGTTDKEPTKTDGRLPSEIGSRAIEKSNN